MSSHRTHTIQLGPHTLPLTLPITQRQRMTVYAEYLDAQVRLAAAVKSTRDEASDINVRDLWALGALVEAGAAIALVRMLPSGHDLRADYEAGAYSSAPDPALACGDAIIERLATEGVAGSEVNAAAGALMGLGDAGPTQVQVDGAVGNSGATLS